MRVLAVTICAVFSILVMVSCTANKGSFLFINNAKEPILRGLVTICGQTIDLKDIQPGESVPGSYKVKSDSHYDIGIEFQSGKKLRKETGYVTNGFDYHDEIVVTDADIELINKKTMLNHWSQMFYNR